MAVLTGTFTATGQSAGLQVYGNYNITLTGTFVATVRIERSFDEGASWAVLSKDAAGTPNAYTSALSLVLNEPENSAEAVAGATEKPNIRVRLNCTSYTSGTVNYRISQ